MICYLYLDFYFDQKTEKYSIIVLCYYLMKYFPVSLVLSIAHVAYIAYVLCAAIWGKDYDTNCTETPPTVAKITAKCTETQNTLKRSRTCKQWLTCKEACLRLQLLHYQAIVTRGDEPVKETQICISQRHHQPPLETQSS